MVSIHSEEQNKLVANLTGGRNAWLGGFRTAPGPVDQFIWIDGTFLDYSKWDSDQPDNYKGLEFCIEMRGSSFWNDQKCDNRYEDQFHFHVIIDTFVCQCDLK